MWGVGTRRIRIRALGLLLAGCGAGAALALLSLPQSSGASSVRKGAAVAAAFIPVCPSPTYSPDGNVSPLFCTVVNPAALKFYTPLFPRLFALSQDAQPVQVENALKSGMKIQHGTIPEMCAAYSLWHYRWHWNFTTFNPADAAVTAFPNACGR